MRALVPALLIGVVSSGCAWHRIAPPRVDRPEVYTLDEAVGLSAADEETSLNDLRAVSRLWQKWGVFRAVQFPYRDGDPVDLVVEVRLRQRAEVPSGANILKAVAVGLSLFTLSPFLGASVSELHDVQVHCRRGGDVRAVLEATVRSDGEIGAAADPVAAAKELEDVQMQQIAAKILEGIASGCRAPPVRSARWGLDPRPGERRW